MANIEIKIEKKETTVTVETVQLPIPCFFRNESETYYIGLLDEATVVEITSDEFENSIRNFNNKTWRLGIDRIKHAYSNFISCTETEFIEKYAAVEKSMSLNPILAP